MSAALHLAPGDGTQTRRGARETTDLLRISLANLHRFLADVQEHTLTAWETRADEALGYTARTHPVTGRRQNSWEHYCEVELAAVRDLDWSPAMRRALVEDLRRHGMSHRAIAAVLGIGERTVRVDARDVEPPATSRGTDGKTYTRRLTAVPDPAPEQEPAPAPAPAAPRPSNQDVALAAIRAAGPDGLTSAEVGAALGWHHGQSSSAASKLVRQGRVDVAATKRDGYRVLVATTAP